MAQNFDLAVVGGGVLGLSVARTALLAGLRVAVIERGRCGSGASGTILGALLPHLPGAQSPKKDFQFQALLTLPEYISALEAETGLATGFRRAGRIMPIRRAGFLERARVAAASVPQRWQGAAAGIGIELLPPGAFSDVLAAACTPFGVVQETLSAYISAPDYIAALTQSLRRSPAGALFEGATFTGYDPSSGRVSVVGGQSDLVAERIVLAAGYETYPFLRALVGLELGGGDFGAAALLRARLPEATPVIYDDGVYIVRKDDEHCAVGSASKIEVYDKNSVTVRPEHIRGGKTLDDVIARARQLSPRLADAPVVSTWMGVRPRSAARNPIVGALDDPSRIHVATGGHKITFGIAHRLARVLIERMINGASDIPMPPTFEVVHHLRNAGD